MLDKEVVQSPTLRHVNQRTGPAANEASAPTEAELHPVYDVLHDRLWIDRQLAHGADGDSAAARLVARERRLVEEQYACALARQSVGRGRARRTGADDNSVELFH